MSNELFLSQWRVKHPQTVVLVLLCFLSLTLANAAESPLQRLLSMQTQDGLEDFLINQKAPLVCPLKTLQNVGHSSPVTCAHINETLGACVTGNERGEVVVWDLKSQRVITAIPAAGEIIAVELTDQGVLATVDAWCPSGPGVHAGGVPRLRLFEAVTGKLIKEEKLVFEPHRGASSAISISRNLFCEVDELPSKNDLSSFAGHGRGIALRRLVEKQGAPSQGAIRITLPKPKNPREKAVRCWVVEKPELKVVIATAVYNTTYTTSGDFSISGVAGDTYIFHVSSETWEVKAESSRRNVFGRSADVSSGYGIDRTPQILEGFAAESDNHALLLRGGDAFLMVSSADGWTQTAALPKRNGLGSLGYLETGKTLLAGDRMFSFEKLEAGPNGAKDEGKSRTNKVMARVPARDGEFILETRGIFAEELHVLKVSHAGQRSAYTMDVSRFFSDFPVGVWQIGTFPGMDVAAIVVDGQHKAFGGLFLLNLRTSEIRQAKELNDVQSVFFLSPQVVVACCSTSMKCLDVKSLKELGRWDSMESRPPSNNRYFAETRWAMDRNGGRMFYLALNGSIHVLDIRNPEEIQRVGALFFEDGENWVIAAPSGEYMGKAEAISQLHFVGGFKRVHQLEQFDARLNRPDVVLERLSAPREAVEVARDLREKRLRRMRLTEEMLKPDFHVPEVCFASDVPPVVESPTVDIRIHARDSVYPLESLRVYVNNVPSTVQGGYSLREHQAKTLEKTVRVELSSGRNKIQVSVVNSAGAESLFANTEILLKQQERPPVLYLAMIGVSKYERSEWDLEYAAKDALDISAKMETKGRAIFREIRKLILTDKDVEKGALDQVIQFMEPASVGDVAVIFMAGHGFLDANNEYFFGSSEMDPLDSDKRGISFQRIEEMLWKTRCFKKVLLMDTCHAGELDEEDQQRFSLGNPSSNGQNLKRGGVIWRAVGERGLALRATASSRERGIWHKRISLMFIDIRRNSGATVLASSGGAEVAFEGGGKRNGLFTHAVLEALDGAHGADGNRDGKIQLGEVTEYVSRRVAELSGNLQIPNTRQINREANFDMVSLVDTSKNDSSGRKNGSVDTNLGLVTGPVESVERLQARALEAGGRLDKVYKKTRSLLRGAALERLVKSQKAWIQANQKALDIAWKSHRAPDERDRAVLEVDTMMCENRAETLELLLRATDGLAAVGYARQTSGPLIADAPRITKRGAISLKDASELKRLVLQMDLLPVLRALGISSEKLPEWLLLVKNESEREAAEVLMRCLGN